MTYNSRLFAVTSTTCSTLVLAVCVEPFFPPIDIQQALIQHTQCTCRFVILATKALQSQGSRQTYIFTHKCTRYQVHTRYTHVCCVWVVFLEHGGGTLGIFKSPVCTYDQAWTFSLSVSHYFSFLSKRSGRRMPPVERSALYRLCIRTCFCVRTSAFAILHDQGRFQPILPLNFKSIRAVK